MALTAITCSSCGLSDMLRRLSSIQAAHLEYGVPVTDGTTSWRIVADHRLTALPPPPPRPPLPPDRFYPKAPSPLTRWVLLMAWGFFLIVLGGLSTINRGFLALFIIGLILSSIGYPIVVERWRCDEEWCIVALADERRIAERHATGHSVWVRWRALWSVAFYCSRCDVVMIPAGVVPGPLANGMSCHADDLHAALSDRARHLDEDALRQLASWQPRYTDK